MGAASERKRTCAVVTIERDKQTIVLSILVAHVTCYSSIFVSSQEGIRGTSGHDTPCKPPHQTYLVLLLLSIHVMVTKVLTLFWMKNVILTIQVIKLFGRRKQKDCSNGGTDTKRGEQTLFGAQRSTRHEPFRH